MSGDAIVVWNLVIMLIDVSLEFAVSVPKTICQMNVQINIKTTDITSASIVRPSIRMHLVIPLSGPNVLLMWQPKKR